MRRLWLASGTCMVLLTLLAACGRPGDDQGDVQTPVGPKTDKTPINTELDIGFDGEVPDMAVGDDGTLHVLFRRVKAPTATLY